MSPNYKKERELWELGYKFVCGIDEAGRGALAGPLVSGAVILKPRTKNLFNDSKLLSQKKREELFEIVMGSAISWAIGLANIKEINEYGIQGATYLSYLRAIKNLKLKPSFLLIDHYRLPGTHIPQASITKGDRLSQTIAAASIVAKVSRDRLMTKFDSDFPCYKFKNNFGYGTKYHQNAIAENGVCSIHRLSFIDKPSINQLNFI